MNYRSLRDLNNCLIYHSNRFRSFELIVAVPRSGLLVGTLLSLLLQKPLIDLESFAGGRFGTGGRRLQEKKGEKGKVLVLDDSVTTGTAMTAARRLLENKEREITYACIYVTEESKHFVDIFCEVIPHPRVFEWNVFHHCYGHQFCFDMDGVLCADPEHWQNDDADAYLEFINSAKPLHLPSVEIGSIVTCRLEKYREPTERWLREHYIQFKELVMMPFSKPAERIAYGHARYKAEVYTRMSNRTLFIESSEDQATEIFRLTGRPVLSIETMVLHSQVGEHYSPPASMPVHACLQSDSISEKGVENSPTSEGKIYPRGGMYSGSHSREWFSEKFEAWKKLFSKTSAIRALEIGSGSGASVNMMLDELFTHPESEIHAIIPSSNIVQEPTPDDFSVNSIRGKHAHQLHLYEGTSCEALAWMIAGEGYWESFDFIHLRTSTNSASMLSDACQAWYLLKPHGVMIFGDGPEALRAFVTFSSIYASGNMRFTKDVRLISKEYFQ